MTARNLLHKDKLEGFKSWLDSKGREHRPGGGAWQVLQIRWGSGWQAIFERAHMPEHLSIPGPLIPLVQAYIRESRAEKSPTPPPGYTAEELERDNPYNNWMREDGT
jgi:hypothetical protein